jgi:AraC family transcriptional activator of pobA
MKLEYKKHDSQFNVAAIGENKCTLESYSRRYLFKIGVITEGFPFELQYGSLARFKVDKPCLILINPMIPHAWTVADKTLRVSGFFCVFNNGFIRTNPQLSAMSDRLLNGQESPVYFPIEVSLKFLISLFSRMRAVADQEYAEKNDLFKSHLNLILHEANQMRTAREAEKKGSSRITDAFMRLLSTQFPVDLPLQPIKLKTASDYADVIAVHVNHLNTAIKNSTGKSTSAFINEKILAEAQSLLAYTCYSIAEIADGLGFEYQSYFNHFFRKHAGMAPSFYRKNFEKYK